MSSTAPSPATERLAGIEWMRGIAAFGVICIHAGLAVHNRTTQAADELTDLAGFAVSFFLLTSFFFAIRAEEGPRLPWGDWMCRRCRRLIVPYAFWSTVYVSLQVGKLWLHHQVDEIAVRLGDPAMLILNGGNSVALYFLPLVFTGLVLIHLLSSVLKRLPSLALVIGFFAALGLRYLWLRYGSGFNIDPSASGAPLKLALGLFKYALRCLPLIFVAALMVRHLPSPSIRFAWPFIITGAIYLIVPYFLSPPPSATDSVLGLGAFLVAWGLSGLISPGKWAFTVGLFSFGVYLVHQVFLELIQMVYSDQQPAGVVTILAITATVFAASMLTVGVANRGGKTMRLIFGLK
jgi:peptidoglycan/LPS O-acetylase OafA/YrhL